MPFLQNGPSPPLNVLVARCQASKSLIDRHPCLPGCGHCICAPTNATSSNKPPTSPYCFRPSTELCHSRTHHLSPKTNFAHQPGENESISKKCKLYSGPENAPSPGEQSLLLQAHGAPCSVGGRTSGPCGHRHRIGPRRCKSRSPKRRGSRSQRQRGFRPSRKETNQAPSWDTLMVSTCRPVSV